MQIITDTDKEIVAQKAAAMVGNLIKRYSGRPTLFLTSGGSSLHLLDLINPEVFTENLTVTVLDDRFSNNPAINNFLQLKSTKFYESCMLKGSGFIETVPLKDEDLDQCAKRFEVNLKNWMKQNPKGVVIATVGVGPDGHTSGMMPFPEDPIKFKAMFESESLVTGYDAGNKNPLPLRITVTMTFLRKHVDHVITFMTGDEKKESFRKIKSYTEALAKTPARILKELKDVVVFTDL